MKITVVNKHHRVEGEYIGRGSPLGNMFTHLHGIPNTTHVASRDEAVDLYEMYIRAKIAGGDEIIIKELSRLYRLAEYKPLNLVCYCAPQRCHGDVIKRIIEDEYKKQNTDN